MFPELGEARGQIGRLRARITERLHPRSIGDIATLERIELRKRCRVPPPPRLVRDTSDLQVQRVIDLVEQRALADTGLPDEGIRPAREQRLDLIGKGGKVLARIRSMSSRAVYV